MTKKRQKLGEILTDWGLITEETVTEALQYGMEHRKRIGEALVEMEKCSEDDIAKALASQFGLEYIDLDHHAVDRNILELIPESERTARLIEPRACPQTTGDHLVEKPSV